MSSLVKTFIYSFLLSLGLVALGVAIDFFRMDNASKEYLQVLYFFILVVLAIIGNITLLTRSAGKTQRRTSLHDFSVSLLSIGTGFFGLLLIETSHTSPFTIASIIITVVGVIGAIRTVLIARRTII